MYMESSWPSRKNDNARILSRTVQANSRSCLVFYYFMYGRTMGRLSVFARDRFSEEETLIWSLKEDQGRGWKEAKVPLNLVNSSPFQVISPLSLYIFYMFNSFAFRCIICMLYILFNALAFSSIILLNYRRSQLVWSCRLHILNATHL